MTTENPVIKIHFEPEYQSEFFKTLGGRVNAYFKDSGKSKKANSLLMVKGVVYSLWTFGGFALLYTQDLSVFLTFLLFIFSGVGSTLFVINLAHDASHHALSSRKWINRVLSYIWNLTGISSYMWDLIHNQSHHVFTNIPNVDPDISLLSQSGIMRLHPTAPRHKHQRFQHIYAPFLYMLYSFFYILFKDIPFYSKKQFGNRIIENHTRTEWLILYATKIFYLSYSLILPLLLINHPWWLIVLMYLAMHAVSGLIAAILLITPHVNLDSHYTMPNEEGMVRKCWGIHQVESTVDFAADSFWVSLFSGGLNTHVAHHLFPGICHVHYRAISQIIQKTALEYGITYQNRTALAVFKGHFQKLKKLGGDLSYADKQTLRTNPI